MSIKGLAQIAAQYGYWLLNRRALEYQAWRDGQATRVRMLLPFEYRYHAKPTFEQVRALVDEIETTTIHNVTSLCETLAAGNIPEDVDAIIARHAKGWASVEEASK